MKERLPFKTLKMDQAFELREYVPLLLAKVKVPGPFEAALKRGGFLLQDYYFGQNYKKERLPLRPPFFLSSRPDGWEVACFLPAELTARELPKPIGDDIRFEERLAQQVAVMKVHGSSHYPSLMRKTEELRAWVQKAQIQIVPGSRIAVYQSPILPFLRRNEIHFDAHSL